MINFTTQYVNELYSANYFGEDFDAESTQSVWLEEMSALGFEVGNEYDEDSFDEAAQTALENTNNLEQVKASLSTTEDNLLTVLTFGEANPIAFHGSGDCIKDLQKRYDGIADCLRYEEVESAANQLVALRLAEWKGNQWLYATSKGIAIGELD